MRKSLALALVLLLAITANAFAVGQARITGKVTDAVTKKPIENATITVTAMGGKTFKETFKVKPKDGTYAIFLLDGTLRYEFTWSAPNYQSYKEVMKLSLGDPNIKDVLLAPAGVVAATVPAAEIKVDPAVAAFNAGAALANEGKDAEALVKFQESITTRPDLIAGWQALAKVNLRLKNYDKAIEAADKALEADSEDMDMLAVLYESYNQKGDKVKAAEYRKRLPANAAALFNDAAKAINAGKDGDAEPLLKQSVAADPTFSQAYYELGMLYVRAGKNADARANLQKYLELAPTGKDAATAKEMLNYVK